MSRERARQKKLEKAKKKRGAAQKKARESVACRHAAPLDYSLAPFGPAWISESFDEAVFPPPLVTVLLSRRLVDGAVLLGMFLVDRTCLGVKNAGVLGPYSPQEVDELLAETGRRGEPLIPAELEIARSVVFHGIDYARTLGLAPHPDLDLAFLGPRPSPMRETMLSRPQRPLFIPGPRDDVARIRRALDASVGRLGYDVLEDEGGAGFDGSVPAEDLLRGLDLGTESGVVEAAELVSDLLESGFFAIWAAVDKRERGETLAPREGAWLAEVVDDPGEPVELVDGRPRPIEPWFVTARRVAESLVLTRCVTSEPHDPGLLPAGVCLLDAIDRHAPGLSLPDGGASPLEVIPEPTRHRLLVQAALQLIERVGMLDLRGERITLCDAAGTATLRDWVEELHAVAASLEALGWSVDDLLELVVLPEADRAAARAALLAADLPFCA